TIVAIETDAVGNDSPAATSSFTSAVATPGHPIHITALAPLQIHVPAAVGGGTVFGQLTVFGATRPGFVTAYACAEGMPVDAAGNANQSDVNYNGGTQAVASNRLIVTADFDGDV